MVGIQSVPHDSSPGAKRQTDIVEPAEALLSFARGLQPRKTDRFSNGGESPLQIQTSNVEGEFRPQRHKKAQDVIGRLAKGVRDQVDTPVPDFRKNAPAGLVTFVETKAVTRRRNAKHPTKPTPLVAGLAQLMVGARIPIAQLGAQEYTVPKLELRQMLPDSGEIVLAQLLFEHRKKSLEAL